MISFSIPEQGRNTAWRRKFTALVFVWLNLLITPCTFAMGAEHTCPHTKAAVHHEHGQEMAGHPCAAMQDDCCDSGIANVDARGDLKLNKLPEPRFLPVPGFVNLQTPVPTRVSVIIDPPDPPGACRPLHVINCVYRK